MRRRVGAYQEQAIPNAERRAPVIERRVLGYRRNIGHTLGVTVGFTKSVGTVQREMTKLRVRRHNNLLLLKDPARLELVVVDRRERAHDLVGRGIEHRRSYIIGKVLVYTAGK